MGSLVAHELARNTATKPLLLLKTKKRLDAYNSEGSTLTLLRPNGPDDATTTTQQVPATVGPPADGGIIENMIIATKTYATEAALRPYVPQMNENTRLILLQNGMGMAQALNKAFWQNQSRPQMYQAISTHGAYKASPTTVHHVGLGSLAILRVFDGIYHPEPVPEMINELVNCDALNATYISSEGLLLRQMEKLVVNACINPLTAVLDCLNGDLLLGTKVVPIFKRVIRECVEVFHAEYSILRSIPDANTHLDPERLLFTTLAVCKNTAQNSSSMREDVRQLRTTEINWINGYITALGFKHSVPTPTNKMLVSLVSNKLTIEQTKERALL